MKQVAQNYRTGELRVLDVPVPACKPGGLLVASSYSVISTGTEMMKVDEARLSLLGKARRRPDQVRKVVESVAQVGPAAAYQKVVNRLDSWTPLGYSLSGVVLEVGAGVEGFSVGDLVACAGNEHALHADVNWVPTNLCVPVPEGVDPRLAAFATVGAIAMHAIRRGETALGETACVIGLGLIGQLTTQLLLTAGLRVVGVDPVEGRRAAALAAGATVCASPTAESLDDLERSVAALTDGLGVDHVFLAAGGPSNDPVHLAARLARDRARVVDIGKCRLDLPWNEYYDKELDVRFSRSYGPGRYDDTYELDGVDYPAGYVRWTERRNLACFLDLVARTQLRIELLVSDVFPLEQAADVYSRMHAGELNGVGFLFEYPTPSVAPSTPTARPTRVEPSVRTAPSTTSGAARHSIVRVGFVGAGNYASSMLLPHLRADERVELVRVATTTSLSAVNAQHRFGFGSCSTDVDEVLGDPSIDAVFVVTRHRSHAELASRALESGKAVFVEKPLALTAVDLQRVLDVIDATGNERLMVGFNRRFAPLLMDLRERFGRTNGPALVRYLVNAGQLDPASWYADAAHEGTRFEGEGGHFIDTTSWWLDARPIEVHATGASADDLVVTIRFDDGSVATITYTSNGSRRFPKETFEASASGRTARLDNFRRATLWSGRRRRTRRAVRAVDKGQREQLARFVEAVRSAGAMPIPLSSLVSTTNATLAVARSLGSGHPEKL